MGKCNPRIELKTYHIMEKISRKFQVALTAYIHVEGVVALTCCNIELNQLGTFTIVRSQKPTKFYANTKILGVIISLFAFARIMNAIAFCCELGSVSRVGKKSFCILDTQ